MKKIEACIKTHKLVDVSLALHHTEGVNGMMVTTVRGWGKAKCLTEKRDHASRVSDFETHEKIEVMCEEEFVETIIQTIVDAAHTGLLGDGRVFVIPMEKTVSIRTGDFEDN